MPYASLHATDMFVQNNVPSYLQHVKFSLTSPGLVIFFVQNAATAGLQCISYFDLHKTICVLIFSHPPMTIECFGRNFKMSSGSRFEDF